MNYKKELMHLNEKYLNKYNMYKIKPGLERIEKILEYLDNPHEKIKTIHVGGTNGKGSSVAMLSQILIENNYKTGYYISPILSDFREHFVINGKKISKTVLARGMEKIRKLDSKKKINLSYYEFKTALAFYVLEKEKVDVAIIEVCMGGTWDSTNVINPILSIITSISLDHENYLGKSIRKIAKEKFGIIKNNSVTILNSTNKEIIKDFKKIAKDKNSKSFIVNENFTPLINECSIGKNSFKIKELSNLGKIELNLKGLYQIQNSLSVILAIKTLKKNKFKISMKKMKKALKETYWPCRMEIIKKNPMIILDGAHNQAGIKQLSKNLKLFFNKKIILVFCLSHAKNPKILKPLFKVMKEGIVFDSMKSEKGSKIINYFKSEKIKLEKCANIQSALKKAVEKGNKKDIICITGSLYPLEKAKNVNI